MKTMGQLLLLIVPVLALVAFFIVMKQWGGIAPAAPVSESTIEVELPVPRTAQRQPTVLSPQPSDQPVLPPGMETSESELESRNRAPFELPKAPSSSMPSSEDREANLPDS